MRYTLCSLFLVVTVTCVVIGWCVCFRLGARHLVPGSLAILGAALCAGALFPHNRLKLECAIVSAQVLVLESLLRLHAFYNFIDSSKGTIKGIDWVIDEVRSISAGVVILPAIALLPILYFTFQSPVRKSLYLIISLAIVLTSLLFHILLLNVAVS